MSLSGAKSIEIEHFGTGFEVFREEWTRSSSLREWFWIALPLREKAGGESGGC